MDVCMGKGTTYGSPSITQTETTKMPVTRELGSDVVLLPACVNVS